MQPIKFMVWNSMSKEWTYFDTPMVSLVGDFKVVFKNATADKIMIGGYSEIYQFTGQTDVEGTEIYAGHLFEVPCAVIARDGEKIAWYNGVKRYPDERIAMIDIVVVVEWDEKIGGYTLRGERKVEMPFWCWAKKIFKEHKIIGHVEANPELLEVKK